MSVTKNIFERVQSLPIELIREIKNRLDPESQITLLKDKPSVYANVKKTVNNQYIKTYLKEPSMRALRKALKKEQTKITHTICDDFGNNHLQSYYINCKLPGNVIANMYETNIHKPMLEALKKTEEDAPMVFDLDGKMKPCITPLEKSIIARFKTMFAPVKPNYRNERTKMRYTRALEDYHNFLPRKVYELLEDFENCASFISDFDYAIRMSSLNFLKALCVLSKQYLQSPIDELLSRRTLEDIKIDQHRKAYYAKNIELLRESRERENMMNEMDYMNKLMIQEAKIREQQAKEQRKLARKETKTKKLLEKEEKIRLREERINKKAQEKQEKALRAILREQTRAEKLAEKKQKMEQKRQKDAELAEIFAYKMIRTMFV